MTGNNTSVCEVVVSVTSFLVYSESQHGTILTNFDHRGHNYFYIH